MTRFTLWKSDRSPSDEQFEAVVREIATTFGAVWLDDDDDHDLRLRDGTGLEVWFENKDEGLQFILDAPHEGAFELVHAIADQTACFTTSDPHAPARALPSTGGILPRDEGELAAPTQVDRRAFLDWMRTEMNVAPNPRRNPSGLGQTKRSLLQRLSDALFGKEM